MADILKLEKAVKGLYESNKPGRADWADWLYANHVIWVANEAELLAKRFGANAQLARAAALLHDIADATTKREDPNHESESLVIARDLLNRADFTEDEIRLIVDDAIRYHSCRDNERSVSLEGRCLATADALAHLRTNFYPFAIKAVGKNMSLESINQWASEKIDRDYHKKILFDEIQTEAEAEYKAIKQIFEQAPR